METTMPINYAGFWRRFAAFIIDRLLLFIFYFFILLIFNKNDPGAANNKRSSFSLLTITSATTTVNNDSVQAANSSPELHSAVHTIPTNSSPAQQAKKQALYRFLDPLFILSLLLTIVAQWLYFALMESSSKEATLGKMAIGIKVVDEQGKRLTFSRASGRHFAKGLSKLTFGIGYILAGLSVKKQALHDMISGCLVIIDDSTELLERKRKEMEIVQLKEMRTKAELESLQSKINPHFLYNALNSIAGLAHESPGKVEKMALALSRFFRYSINSSSNNYSTIEDETELLNLYMDIEKIRFEKQLDFQLRVDADPTYLIPRFLLQPLVENAVKHGTSRITGTGFIRVSVIEKNGCLELEVQDNGPDFPTDLFTGYGLKSTYDKLDLLFPGNYEVFFENGKNKHIKIIIKKRMTHE